MISNEKLAAPLKLYLLICWFNRRQPSTSPLKENFLTTYCGEFISKPTLFSFPLALEAQWSPEDNTVKGSLIQAALNVIV